MSFVSPQKMLRKLRGFATAAGGAALSFLLSGCNTFVFVHPELPPEEIPHAAADPGRRYRLTGDDGWSCLVIHLPREAKKHPVPAAVICPGGAYGVLAWDKDSRTFPSHTSRMSRDSHCKKHEM